MRAITIALAFAVAAVCAAQERVVSVCGAEKINSTGITVHPGEKWRFEVIGSSPACDDCRHNDPRLSECDRPGPRWSDGKRQPCVSAEGWELWYLRPFFFLKRVRSAHWYELTGAVYKGDRARQTFAIGLRTTPIPIDAEGELVLFANDASWRYANNYGSLRVRITPVE